MDGKSADLIRKAVSSGEFPKAMLLWEEHVRRLSEEMRSGFVPHSRLDETRDLVEWARLVALSARAHVLERIDNTRTITRVAAAYGRIVEADS